MAGPDEFEDALAESLDLIDRVLAENDVPLTSRPRRAAQNFVRFCVIEVETDTSTGPIEPGEFLDYMDSDWFKLIYARTFAWYRQRYGDSMSDRSDRTITGVTLVLGTPFRMKVPLVTTRPGKPGETIWMHYPAKVEDGEDSLSWVERAPNFAMLPRGDGMKARRLANGVAGALRSIYCGMFTVSTGDPRVSELRDPILPHLDQAAVQIVTGKPVEIKRAQWELQMACELSLKMLSQQRGGSFTETHDLYVLHDRLPPGKPHFPRALLSRIPNWEVMTEWRYGHGPNITIAEAFSRYRASLQVVDGLMNAADRKYRFHGASFEIRKAPYLHDDHTLFEPRPTK